MGRVSYSFGAQLKLPHTTLVGGSVADPSLLPAATGQARAAGTYGLSLSAGQTYVDPNSGVTVLKLTDSSTPNAGSHYHGYAEGGPTISQAWTSGGNTYYTIYLSFGYFVDVRYDNLAISNWRVSPVDGEINVAFSLNPATPRICYRINDTDDKTVIRRDTSTDTDTTTGIFPFTPAAVGTNFTWLQTQVNDTWLVGMCLSNLTVIGIKVADGTERAITAGVHDVDEPHIDREYPVVYISTNDIQNWVVDLTTGSTVTETGPDNDAADHESGMRGFCATYHFTEGMVKITKDGVRSTAVTTVVKPPSAEAHQSGCWVFDNPDHYVVIDCVNNDNAAYPLREHMIGMVSMDTSDVRLICCGDNSGADYDTGGQMHPQISPDGKLLLWTTNMNLSGGYQVFLAKLPVS